VEKSYTAGQAIDDNTIQYNTTQYNTIQYNTIRRMRFTCWITNTADTVKSTPRYVQVEIHNTNEH